MGGGERLFLGLVQGALTLDRKDRAWTGLDEGFDNILDDLALMEDGGYPIFLRPLIGIERKAEAGGFRADLHVVFLRQLTGLFDEGREIKISLSAGGGNLGRRETFGGRTATFEFGLHRGDSALGAGEIRLNCRGHGARRHGRQILHGHQLGLPLHEFFGGGPGSGEPVIDEPALAQHEQRAQRQRRGKEGVFAIPVHTRLTAFSSG